MKIFGQWQTWPQAAAGLAGRLRKPVLVRLADAYQFAADCHQGQTRPAGQPYTQHLLEVLEILATHVRSADPVVLTAGLLHDIVEDTAVTLAGVARRFDRATADLVAQVTMPPVPAGQDKAATRAARLDRLATASESVRHLKLADRYSNVQRLRTHPRPAKQRAYYRETCQHVLPLAAADPAFADLFAAWRDAYAYLASPTTGTRTADA